MRKKLLPALLFLVLTACHPAIDEVERASAVYDRLIQHMSADSIANMYTADGKLGNITGRDSIRQFLQSFTDVRVLHYASKTKSITIHNDLAWQEGTYQQDVRVKQDTLHLRGSFRTVWQHTGDRWLVFEMTTQPDTSQTKAH